VLTLLFHFQEGCFLQKIIFSNHLSTAFKMKEQKVTA